MKQTQPSWALVPVLCLDLDGTVRTTISGKTFAENRDDYKLIDGIEDKINEYIAKGYAVLGFTNQGGVAWGYKTEDDCHYEAGKLLELFKGPSFTRIYSSHNDERGTIHPYNTRSLMRKPHYGMLVMAEVDAYKEGWIIDWNSSLFVGDRPEDKQCAAAAGIAFMHIDQFLKA